MTDKEKMIHDLQNCNEDADCEECGFCREDDCVMTHLVDYKKSYEKQILKRVNYNNSTEVKAFDGKDKVETFRCVPCPICEKWIISNPVHKFCQYCGQKIDWRCEDD